MFAAEGTQRVNFISKSSGELGRSSLREATPLGPRSQQVLGQIQNSKSSMNLW